MAKEKERFPRRVAVVGLGGLGSPTALALAKAGYQLILFDFDKVEHKNISNQVYGPGHVGKLKVEAMAAVIDDLALTNLQADCGKFTRKTFVGDSPIVVCAVDSLNARREVLESCKGNIHARLLVEARAGGDVVEIYAVNPHSPEAVKRYEKTLVQDEGAPEAMCIQPFHGHVGMVCAGLIVRAIEAARLTGGIERFLRFNVRTLHMIIDGPHPWQ